MTDPISVGMLVASALSLGAEAAAKTEVSEIAKDAYNELKSKISIWAVNEVSDLEKTPGSDKRKLIISEIIDGLPYKHRDELRFLALELLENPPAANAKLRAAAMAMPSPERTY